MRRAHALLLGLAPLVGAVGAALAQSPAGVPPDTRERRLVAPPVRSKILYEMR